MDRLLIVLINYETVKYFNNESFEVNRYDSTLSEWENAAVTSQTSMSILNFGQGAIIAVGLTFIMVYAGQGVIDGKMSLGDLVLINTMMLQLFYAIKLLRYYISYVKTYACRYGYGI